MTEVSPKEKLLNTLLLFAAVTVGWGPFVWSAWHKPYVSPPMLMISLSLAVVALGAAFDAALGAGFMADAVLVLPAGGAVLPLGAPAFPPLDFFALVFCCFLAIMCRLAPWI